MSDILLQPWAEEDLPLLEKLLGDPDMMEHFGGAESPEQILRRHQRYLHLPEEGTDHIHARLPFCGEPGLERHLP